MAKKLLIIEDSPLIRQVYSKFFVDKGFQVKEAYDGEQGYTIAKKFLPDIILLDMIMPKLGGFGTLDKIKKDMMTEHIPIVILTSNEREDERVEALSMGASSYELKTSSNPDTILAKIDELLN